MSYCWLNGEILDYADCQLHISDLQIQRGYGVFDYFRCREGKIPWLNDYTNRLFHSMKLSGIEAPMSSKEFTSVIADLKEKNKCVNAAFKVLVTGGYSETLDSVTGPANMLVLNVPWKSPPEAHFSNGVKLISCEYQRPNPEVKTLYYFNSMRLIQGMKEADAVEVLYYTDLVTEASRASVFFVKDGQVFTTASNILDGITRKQVLARFSEIKVQDIPAGHLFDFDEMFITSTTRDITPVVAVDGKKIGEGRPGKVTRELMSGMQF